MVYRRFTGAPLGSFKFGGIKYKLIIRSEETETTYIRPPEAKLNFDGEAL